MPSLQSIDLIVTDVPRAVAFFRDVVGAAVLQSYARFAELETQSIKLLLSPDALTPMPPAQGVILHFEEGDLSAAITRTRSFGGAVLSGPLKTDWGTESVLVQGPEGVVVDFFRWANVGEEAEPN